jgi:hypothetical protein
MGFFLTTHKCVSHPEFKRLNLAYMCDTVCCREGSRAPDQLVMKETIKLIM